MKDHRGKESTTLNTTDVLTLNEENVDDSMFEIPAGYEEAAFMNDGEAGAESEEDDPLSELRDLFKRKKN
ncbi:MAG: hypothetical protein HKN15_04150 [Xanthomonadales bacterium]|nr:hypothetical protein [Xanthomonadales bacterium]